MTQARDPLQAFVEDADALRIDTDVDAQQRENRERLLSYWSTDVARRLADQRGYQLTDDHLAVIQVLRNQYLEQGPASDGRELEELLSTRFESQGGKPYLYRLFPNGPVTEALIAGGLPIPPHTVDASFGVAR